jgi:hypothetical protein
MIILDTNIAAAKAATKRNYLREAEKREFILARLRRGIPALGGAMATLTDTPSFTANEVYEIQATDKSEGASLISSFGGIGLSNQPHQQLANRTSFLNNKRIIDETNITILQAFEALFTSKLNAAGSVLRIPFIDSVLGPIVVFIQFGYQTFTYAPNDVDVTVTWPVAFPHACVWAGGTSQSDDFSVGLRSPSTPNFNTTNGFYIMGWNGDNDDVHPPAFFWISIGY